MNPLSTTPDHPNGDQHFTITHPFHPLHGQIFPLLVQSFAWGEERVFFSDQETHQMWSVPLAWTNLAPFLILAKGQAVLRFEDIQSLVQLLNDGKTPPREDR